MTKNRLPETGFLKERQILGQREVTKEEAEQNRREAAEAIERGKKPNRKPKRPRSAIPPIVPVSKTTWWDGIRSGRFPAPEHIRGGRGAFWRVERIRELIEEAE